MNMNSLINAAVLSFLPLGMFRCIISVLFLGHLLLIKKIDYATNFIPICVVASFTFLSCFKTLNDIRKTKCDKLLRSLQKSGSKLSAEERFLAASNMAGAYASMVVTFFFGFFFYLFAQGFMTRFSPIM